MEPTLTPPVTQPVATPIENPTTLSNVPTNKIWSCIDIINLTFMVISALLVFGLDLWILISSFSLLAFYIEMLVVLGISAFFFYYECFVCRKRFTNTKSSLDVWILVLIVLRNLICLLNFIPLIQILGAIIGAIVIVPYVIVYTMLISKRSKVI